MSIVRAGWKGMMIFSGTLRLGGLSVLMSRTKKSGKFLFLRRSVAFLF